MTLRDLEAEFVRHQLPYALRYVGERATAATGVMLNCPGEGCEHPIVLWFANPLDARIPPAPVIYTPHRRFYRSGDSLDTLSLTPTIRLLAEDECGFEGYVVDGTVVALQ